MRDLQADWIAAMRDDDHPAAWSVSDAVLAARDPATRDDPALPYHLRWVWDGTPVAGRHVLVRCYHGLGDTLQFARFLPALRARAASLTVEAQPELLPLLATVAGPDRLVAFDVAAPLPPSECDIEVMEIGHALRLRPDAAPPPYLRAAPAALPPGTLGLCHQAGGWDADRSLPPALLAPLTARPCVILQPRATALRVLNPGGCTADIAETAALVAGCERVVTADTMVAHLAGALNRPTALLLKHDADWRWGTRQGDVGHATSPWYPATRLYRQPAPGDWASAVGRVMADLAAPPPAPLLRGGPAGG